MYSAYPVGHCGLDPQSRCFKGFLDAGLRRHDDSKVNGTAMIKLLMYLCVLLFTVNYY